MASSPIPKQANNVGQADLKDDLDVMQGLTGLYLYKIDVSVKYVN
jgi:hypothetical protein